MSKNAARKAHATKVAKSTSSRNKVSSPPKVKRAAPLAAVQTGGGSLLTVSPFDVALDLLQQAAVTLAQDGAIKDRLDGSLAYRATHHLKSHDYYSSRNYASRLVGSKLVFYTRAGAEMAMSSATATLPWFSPASLSALGMATIGPKVSLVIRSMPWST